MFGFGHIFDIFVLLVLALLVFGPKKMIELGASLGRSLRELRSQLKDLPGMENVANLGGLLDDKEPRRTPFSTMSQFAQNMAVEARDEPNDTVAAASPAQESVTRVVPVVEGSIVSAEESHTTE